VSSAETAARPGSRGPKPPELPTGAPLYEARALSKTYRRGSTPVRALDEVDLAVAPGEFLAVRGPSGSGKSTLLQLFGGLDRPTSGTLTFDGRDLTRLGDRELTGLRLHDIGFVFQQFNLIPTLTAAENVEAGLAPRRLPRAERRFRVLELLTQVGLADRSDHLPSTLSGGEQQRVAIARALVNSPRVILADEPTGNLDSKTAQEVVALLAELCEERGVTVVLVTHADHVAERAGRVVNMLDGQVQLG
jgi:putative ABC transport system ATP-binding protein